MQNTAHRLTHHFGSCIGKLMQNADVQAHETETQTQFSRSFWTVSSLMSVIESTRAKGS